MHDLKAMGASWLRSYITALLTLYMAGETSPTNLLKGGAAAVIPPILRWLNPKDEAFGKQANAE
jgi:hypothetical protein